MGKTIAGQFGGSCGLSRRFSLCTWCLVLPLCCIARKTDVSKMIFLVSGSSQNNSEGGFFLSLIHLLTGKS